MSDASPYVLAIDLGTTNVKVALIDATGRVHDAASEPLATRSVGADGAEQDAEAWWAAIGRCARSAVRAAADGAIAAICVTAQYMSVVAIDALGTPLAPVVMWTDRRGGALHPLDGRHDVWGRWLDTHGLIPLANDDVAHIAVLRATYPDHVERLAAYVEPADAITARLTGRVTATPCTAFPLMCTDNRSWSAVDYDGDLLALAGLDRGVMPTLVDPAVPLGCVTGEAAVHLGVDPSTIVMPATIDSITSAVGSGAIDGSRSALVVGTTSVIATHVDAKGGDLGRAIGTMPSPLPGRYFVMAENGMGGKALELFVDGFVYPDDLLAVGSRPDDAYERVERAAAMVAPGSDGVQFLPWLVGSLAPAPNDEIRGAFVGLGLATTRAHLARAVYEGVALNAAWLLPAVGDLTGVAYREITFGGGGARSRLWGEILASACNVVVHRLADPEHTNARGAALLACAQLGLIDLDGIPDLIRWAETHEPDPEAVDVYQLALARHIQLHGAL